MSEKMTIFQTNPRSPFADVIKGWPLEWRRGKSLRAVHKVRQQSLGGGGSKIEEKVMIQGRGVSKKANKRADVLYERPFAQMYLSCASLKLLPPAFLLSEHCWLCYLYISLMDCHVKRKTFDGCIQSQSKGLVFLTNLKTKQVFEFGKSLKLNKRLRSLLQVSFNGSNTAPVPAVET